jgi:hypothetical protein
MRSVKAGRIFCLVEWMPKSPRVSRRRSLSPLPIGERIEVRGITDFDTALARHEPLLTVRARLIILSHSF